MEKNNINTKENDKKLIDKKLIDKKLIYKILNNIIVPLITIFIIFIVTWFATYIITCNKNYYRWQFEKNNTISRLNWTYVDPESGKRVLKEYDEDDLEIIMNRIVEYMANKESSLQIVDSEGMNVFSNQAIKHMDDVKKVYNLFSIIVLIMIALFPFLIIYFDKHLIDIKCKLKKQLLITFLIIGILLLIVAILLLINSSWTFTQFHHILFPKKEDFNDAFFSRKSNYEEEYYINNLLLVEVLSESTFIDAGWMIIASILIALCIWTYIVFKINKKYA